MKSAYNEAWVYNLAVIKEARRWLKQQLIEVQQFEAIKEAYKNGFYHPNFIIRVLLFIATLFALFGVTGLLGLMVVAAGEELAYMGSIIYGVVSFIFLERVFIKKNHFKSGVTEALLYHACGFTIFGCVAILEYNEHAIFIVCLVVFVFAAIRYLDLIATLAAVLTLAGILFFEFYAMGGIFQQVIPFLFIIFFSAIYLVTKKLQKRHDLKRLRNNFLIVEFLSLLFIYAGGNYLVVRELSVNLLELDLEPGTDIPFAFIFYGLTVIIPVLYLYLGIKNKDSVILRMSLIVVAFSAFTFKYYYSFGHPEISLTIAGIVLLALSIALMNYLKTMRKGFTRENLLAEKWGNMNVEAFIISQTTGGNQVDVDTTDMPGGGGFGGGGASTKF
jgi:hypothetical protein